MYQSLIFRLRKSMRALREFAPIVLAAMALGLAVESAFAVLPTVVTPTGVTSGDYIGVFQTYVKPALLLFGLIICAVAFYVVAGGAIGKFNEYRLGKAELGIVGVYAVTGAVVLIFIIYIVTEASTII